MLYLIIAAIIIKIEVTFFQQKNTKILMIITAHSVTYIRKSKSRQARHDNLKYKIMSFGRFGQYRNCFIVVAYGTRPAVTHDKRNGVHTLGYLQ